MSAYIHARGIYGTDEREAVDDSGGTRGKRSKGKKKKIGAITINGRNLAKHTQKEECIGRKAKISA